MSKIITVNQLSKKYGNHEAVKGISFEVDAGSLFAFLGTNGAGKSTTIDILSTLITKNTGDVTINNYVLGKEDQKIRKDIGVVFQNSVLDNLLTVKENLITRGSFYGLNGILLKKRIEEAARITECNDFLNRRYGKLSGGQRRRADIARALINQPKILFLDEPTTGLDPKTRRSIWDTVKKLQIENGMTVFLTTHYMEEAACADDINIINKGEIIVKGTPEELKEKYTEDVIKIYQPDKNIIAKLEANNQLFHRNKEFLVIPTKKTTDVIQLLYDLKEFIQSFEVVHGTMDDVFLNITGQNKEVE